jgi:hypothetical protein
MTYYVKFHLFLFVAGVIAVVLAVRIVPLGRVTVFVLAITFSHVPF